MVWPFGSAEDRLEREAAAWAVKMHGPERERYRASFENWRRSRPENSEAYDEALESLREGGALHGGDLARARSLPKAGGRSAPLRYAFAGAFALAAAIGLLFLSSAHAPTSKAAAERPVRYAAASQAREVELSDGSRMSLAGGSIAIVRFTRTERRITLERGKGRFTVAHGPRPFRVMAGEAEVVALGTVFDVGILTGRTTVSLIEGVVDVSHRSSLRGSAARSRTLRLKPGEHVVVGGDGPEDRHPSGKSVGRMIQFEDTPLAEVVAEANRYARIRIRLAEPATGRLRLTGAFSPDDPQALAQSLAVAFGLHSETLPDGTLLLSARRPQADSP